MRLKDLSNVLWSQVGCIQSVIIYNVTDRIEMERSCSIEYAVKYYGDWRVNNISAYDNYLVLHVERGD